MSEIFNGFLSSAITTIAIYAFGIIIFNNNKKLKIIYKLLILLFSILIHTLLFLNFEGTIKTVLFVILLMLTFKFIFNISIGKSLLASLLFIIILVVPDLITMACAVYVLKISKEIIYSTIAGGIISNISVSILMILLTYLLRKPLKKIININISSNKKIIGTLVLLLITIGIFFYSLINTFQFNNDVAGSLIAILGLIGIFFYIFKQKIDNDNLAKKYDNLLDIMKNYESDIEEQRTLIHETRNELTTIRCKIKDKEKESEIIKYIDSIMGDKASSNMSKFSKFKYLPSNGLKGFFYYKFTEAERKGIKVSVNISKQIENSILGKLDTKRFKDLARVIGVYLDNAIEASSLSKNKKLGIEIYLIKNNVEIIISNTYQNAIDEEKIGKEKYTTKGKNRGHGLLLVKRILSENKIITSKNEVTDKLYIQKIRIRDDEKDQ